MPNNPPAGTPNAVEEARCPACDSPVTDHANGERPDSIARVMRGCHLTEQQARECRAADDLWKAEGWPAVIALFRRAPVPQGGQLGDALSDPAALGLDKPASAGGQGVEEARKVLSRAIADLGAARDFLARNPGADGPFLSQVHTNVNRAEYALIAAVRTQAFAEVRRVVEDQRQVIVRDVRRWGWNTEKRASDATYEGVLTALTALEEGK